MKRKLIALLFVFVLCFSLAACNSSTQPTSSPATPTATPATTPPTGENVKYKEEIIVVVDGVVTSLDRFRAGTETTVAQRLWLTIFDRLIDKVDGEYVPMLATEWHTDDYKDYTLKLREDVYFHNGEQFTADDVVYTLERAVGAVGTVLYSYVGKDIEKVEAVSDFEVKVTLNKVNVDYLDNLTISYASISNREACEADPEKGIAVGTGPWILDEFVSSEYVKLVRNDNYWGKIPVTKKLTFKTVSEQASRKLMLETGASQAAFGTSYVSDYPVLESDDRFTSFSCALSRIAYFGFNLNDPITGDINFRKAVASVLDREALVQISLNGYAVPYTDGAYWPFEVEFRNNDIPIIPYNIEKAKEYLEKSSYNGEEVTILVSVAENASDAQILQEALINIGVKAKVNRTDIPGMVSILSKGEHMILGNTLVWPLGPSNVSVALLPGAGDNRAFYNNPRVTELLSLAQAETDAAKRENMYKEIQTILAEDIPYLALYSKIELLGALKGVGGVEMRPDGFHRLAYIYMVED